MVSEEKGNPMTWWAVIGLGMALVVITGAGLAVVAEMARLIWTGWQKARHPGNHGR